MSFSEGAPRPEQKDRKYMWEVNRAFNIFEIARSTVSRFADDLENEHPEPSEKETERIIVECRNGIAEVIRSKLTPELSIRQEVWDQALAQTASWRKKEELQEEKKRREAAQHE